MHDHFADLGRGELALRRFVNHAFYFIHNGFQLRRGHRPLLASLQQSLQNLLPFEPLAPAVLLNHHIRNFVDALVGGKSPAALEALPPPPNRISSAAFTRVDHLIVQMRAERTLHSVVSFSVPSREL